jgi:NADH-quinone oxidoreductase subunit N
MELYAYVKAFPEQSVILSGLLIMTCLVKNNPEDYHRSLRLYILTCTIAFLSVFFNEKDFFHNEFIMKGDFSDMLTQTAYVIAICCGFFVKKDAYKQKQEVLILMLIDLIGFKVVIDAQHLMSLFLGVELLSFPLYALIGLSPMPYSTESALKYYLQGSMISALFLYGCSWLYGITASFDMLLLLSAFNSSILSLLSGILVLGLFLFKLGLIPFHFWIFDLYHQAQRSLIFFISLIPKLALLVVISKFLKYSSLNWTPVFIAVILISTLWGNIGAFKQESIQRLLGYASLAQIAFALSGLLMNSTFGLASSLIFIVVYGVGLFFVLIGIHKFNFNDPIPIFKMDGLVEQDKFGAWMMTFGLLSLAGVPPFPGFFSKILIIYELINTQFILLAALLLGMSIFSCAYYIGLIARLHYTDSAKMGLNKMSF